MSIVFLILGWIMVLLGLAWAALAGAGLGEVVAQMQGGIVESGPAILAGSAVMAPAIGVILTGLLFVAVGTALRRLGHIELHTHLAASALDDLNRRVGQELPRA